MIHTSVPIRRVNAGYFHFLERIDTGRYIPDPCPAFFGKLLSIKTANVLISVSNSVYSIILRRFYQQRLRALHYEKVIILA